MISWGLRMAMAGTLPIVWGLATGRLNDMVWVTLTAEAITWVEMKGSFAWRVRTLVIGALLAITFSMLGSVTGNIIWLSVLCMFITGFLATLLKSIGDRASGLALCVYMMFIICNAFPTSGIAGMQHRLMLVALGAAWPLMVGIFISLIMPAEEPFRRQIALIWRAISELTVAVSSTGVDKHNDVYVKEKNVRTAIDNSYQFYGKMAHQVQQKDNTRYQLSLLRKTAGLVSVNILSMGEEIDNITFAGLDESLRIKAGTLMNIMQEAINRISVYVITLRPEEKLLAVSHINRMKKFNELIRQYPLPQGYKEAPAINRMIQLTDRTVKLLESAIQRTELMGKDVRVYRSYSFIKTAFVLRPKYLLRNLQVLFNFKTLTNRYAIRSAIAVSLALFIYKWYNVDHGYWMPFSLMIIIQPYFGATLKKSIDRIIGTLLGGLSGGLLLYFPVGLHLKEIILFLTFLFMVYYNRKHYAVSVFLITLNLVLLFNIESAFSNMIIVSRAISTIGGALLAIVSGFVLLPNWDKKWLPSHLAKAIICNYGYFTTTFYTSARLASWTKLKRRAEGKNSDVFDSFNRYVDEPDHDKTELYYSLITTNVRITRNLNNLHLEQEEKRTDTSLPVTPRQLSRINECNEAWKDVFQLLPAMATDNPVMTLQPDRSFTAPYALNDAQMTSLEKLIIELKTMKGDLEQLVK